MNDEVTQIPPERLAEITSWLQKRVTPEEVTKAMEAEDAMVIEPARWERILESFILLFTGIWIILLYRRIVDGPRRTSAEYFRLWISNYDLTADELWEYDSGGDSWEKLCGERGYAIVRDGVVVDFWMYCMN